MPTESISEEVQHRLARHLASMEEEFSDEIEVAFVAYDPDDADKTMFMGTGHEEEVTEVLQEFVSAEEGDITVTP